MQRDKGELSSDELQKAVELLEIVAARGKGYSLSALAREAGITPYRTRLLLALLEDKGLVQCAIQSGKYDESRARKLARTLLQNARNSRVLAPIVRPLLSEHDDDLKVTILKDARPVLEALARRHNEAIYMAIPNGDEVLLLDMVDPSRQERGELVGRRFPFFANAAGKVMRAIDSWDLLEQIGRRWRGGRGEHPDLAVLRVELEQIREDGVAVECSGMGDGVVTVAVAVRDYAGKVVGALMLIGPSFRLLGDRLEQEIIPSLRLSAELLSARFGYARP
ncbi:IclR family transcriptional regulator [Geomonas sp. Red69]|uniref:IclR family transcriptional regulator n=1 Tax=Geomonas diazotrophica TaxID=2843197 RepID=A0ABX8JCJ8_9BACT|nr:MULTISPECIES: IclR family transcriptional regulator C-terminal domain-containing protein [Geomonas]MBU5636250.1 IclR family transcriptional regulator [Geomonas diazotrophica]QWV96145.1 IclR family transcriptional regulator [Geomonas nitrogeniifigens]QXE85212.1 IclR family transcriptional regulator [Geomonas nitrogeniifigens]